MENIYSKGDLLTMKKTTKILFAMILAVALATTMIAPAAAFNYTGSFMMLLLKQNISYYDGETLVARERITRGEVMTALTLDEKDGLALEGWYTDKELTEKFDFSKPIETGVVLYAKWVDASEIATEEPAEDDVEIEEEVTEEPAEEVTEETEDTTDDAEVTE